MNREVTLSNLKYRMVNLAAMLGRDSKGRTQWRPFRRLVRKQGKGAGDSGEAGSSGGGGRVRFQIYS